MPENIAIAAFVLGAVMLLISIVGGQFKLFGAEVTAKVGPSGRILAGIAGAILIGFGIHDSLDKPVATPTQESANPSSRPQAAPEPVAKVDPPEVLPATYVLRTLTSIRPQEPGGEDRVYLKLGDSRPTKTWTLRAGESVQVDLTVTAGTRVSLFEMDGMLADGDDDFLGSAELAGQGGKLELINPAIGGHLYTLSYEPER